jgi:hypothetical protein
MSTKSIPDKLQLKPGRTVLFINQPEDYPTLLGELPPDVTVLSEPGRPADVIQLFVHSRTELEDQLPKLKPLLTPKGLLWVTYHKGTSKVKTDIHRDSINAYAQTLGLEGIAMISINDDWSALRLKVVP